MCLRYLKPAHIHCMLKKTLLIQKAYHYTTKHYVVAGHLRLSRTSHSRRSSLHVHMFVSLPQAGTVHGSDQQLYHPRPTIGQYT